MKDRTWPRRSLLLSVPASRAIRGALLSMLVATALAAFAAGSAQAAPMTFTVNSTADPGSGGCDVTECTLREAIATANLNTGTDTIAFNISTSSFPPHVITPASALPAITEAVTIDGTTQPDYFHEPAVEIDGTSAGTGVSGLSVGASSTVKALSIGNFDGAGVALTAGSSTIRGTWIGLSGSNGGAGIAVGAGTSNNTIGGTGPDDPNDIEGNGGAGIAISSSGNTIQGSTVSFNTGNGISITTGSNNVVGGTAAGTGNTIQGNDTGVAIAAGTGNAVEGNSIAFSNALGIDLGAAGVTANDHLDPDTGANNLQNFPVLSNASNNSGAGTTTVTGSLDSVASTNYRIEIFASSSCNAAGNGEGEEFVASTNVSTNGSGAATINATFDTPGGNVYTATATDPNGNTSEFSGCVEAPPRLTVQKAGNGTGTVTSTPAGINCGATCEADFAASTLVTLHATPDAGMTFAGWDGAGCSGTGDCVVTLDFSDTVTATFTDPTFPLHLAQSIAHDPSVITGATLTAPPNGTPNAIRTGTLGGYPTDGASYGIMTSGDATLADHVGVGASADDGGGNVRGNTDYDVSILKIDLNVPALANCLTFDFRFYSTEYPTYVGTAFNDAFIAELDTSDWSTSGSNITAPHNFAFDPSHDVISINSTGATAMTAGNASDTGYGGGTAPLHASTVITAGAHSLYLSIFDQGDHILDSAVLLDNLRLSTRDPAACASGATSDNTPPVVTLTTPANGSSTTDTTPTYSGAAGTATGDLDTITVKIYAGNTATGNPVQTLTTTKSGGTWTVDGTTPLAPGTYTAQAEQSDSSGNTGFSSANTFQVTAGVQRTLTVTKNGTGTGTVTSSPAGIDCGATCTHDYNDGTMVTLTPTADVGSQFAGWSGDCSGTGGCTVTMSAARSVTATFNTVPPHDLTVSKSGNGSGTVTSSPAGINCGATCTHSYAHGTVVTLTATPDAGSALTGWSGSGCSGTGTCIVTMDQARSVTATFVLTRTLTVSKNGNGSGTVTSSPAGINCGATCSHDYNDQTVVTLTAAPAAGSAFTGWSGSGCSSTGTCIVTMDAAKSVTATFTLQKHTLNVAKAGSGSGSVSGSPAGIDCGATCSASYDHGTSVTLTATAAAGSTFAGWSGDCSGTGTCTLTMDGDHSVTATFTLQQVQQHTLNVAKAGTGSGTVTSSPAGINCGATCSASYDQGTGVTLTATPASGSTFAGWSGDCTGTGTCTLTMNGDHNVTATFTASITPPPIGGPPVVNPGDLFCGTQHRGKCKGLKIKGIFDRPGNASWTFDAYNPNPGGGHSAAAGKKIRLGQVKRVITKAGTVTIVFKLKKGAKTNRLYKQIKKARLKSILVTLTFTTSSGQKLTSTKTIKLKF